MDKPRPQILFDDRRYERYDPLIAELKRQKIVDYEIFPCILRPNVIESINASQKMMVRNAMERGDKECCIFEDDIMFPAEDGWEYFLQNKPEDFDIYIGGTYLLDEPDTWKPPLVKVESYVGNHCIIIAEKYYERFLAHPDKDHIDNQRGGDFYVCFPFAALQRSAWSSNNRATVNYNGLLKDEYVRGKFR